MAFHPIFIPHIIISAIPTTPHISLGGYKPLRSEKE